MCESLSCKFTYCSSYRDGTYPIQPAIGFFLLTVFILFIDRNVQQKNKQVLFIYCQLLLCQLFIKIKQKWSKFYYQYDFLNFISVRKLINLPLLIHHFNKIGESKMNILSNICNPKQQHFEQEAKTQTYKPLNDYVFQNRNMQKMRARHQVMNGYQGSRQNFQYQSWNHPYAISNFHMFKNQINKIQDKQSLNQQYPHQPTLRKQHSNGSKKISFKDIPQALCGNGFKNGQEGQRHLPKGQNEEQYLKNRSRDYNGVDNYEFSRRNPLYYQGNPQEYEQYRKWANNGNMNSKMMKQSQLNYNNVNGRVNASGYLTHQQMAYQELNNSNTQQYAYSVLSKQILQLKQQNKQLKRLIEQEYKPMRQLYNKLLMEQQQRQYLISKLQFKVKELVKQMGSASTGYPSSSANIIELNNLLNNEIPHDNKKQIKKMDSQIFYYNSSNPNNNQFHTNNNLNSNAYPGNANNALDGVISKYSHEGNTNIISNPAQFQTFNRNMESPKGLNYGMSNYGVNNNGPYGVSSLNNNNLSNNYSQSQLYMNQNNLYKSPQIQFNQTSTSSLPKPIFSNQNTYQASNINFNNFTNNSTSQLPYSSSPNMNIKRY